MAEEFVDLDLTIDSEELADEQFEYMGTKVDGWVPAAANLDTWLLEAGARMGATVGSLALIVSPDVWRVFGENIERLPPIEPAAAMATSTWTLSDASGHDVDGGTLVSIAGIPFVTVTDFTVAAGETSAEDVQLVAVDEGAFGSGLLEPVVLEETLGFDAVIVLDAATEGGRDGELIEVYLDRLAVLKELSAPRPLSVRNVEQFAATVPGVARVLVLDNYRPGPPASVLPEASDVPLSFTVVPIDEAGNPSAASAASELMQLLQANRGTNWAIYLIEPVYTAVDVDFEAVVHRGWDPAAVRLRAIDRVTEYLRAANAGKTNTGDPRTWEPITEVRHRELAAVLDGVEGLDYVPVLKFRFVNDPPDAWSENVDLPLDKPWSLTSVGTITGAVTAP